MASQEVDVPLPWLDAVVGKMVFIPFSSWKDGVLE